MQTTNVSPMFNPACICAFVKVWGKVSILCSGRPCWKILRLCSESTGELTRLSRRASHSQLIGMLWRQRQTVGAFRQRTAYAAVAGKASSKAQTSRVNGRRTWPLIAIKALLWLCESARKQMWHYQHVVAVVKLSQHQMLQAADHHH